MQQCTASCGRVLAVGLCAQARVTPVLLRDTKEARPTFSEDQRILQVWSQGVEELMMKSCESWIPEYQVAYLGCPAESLLAVFPCKTVQAVYVVNVMQRHRTGQVLCLWVLFSLGLFPGMHLQDNGGPLGWESVLGVPCLVMGTCLSSPLPTKERKGFFWTLDGWRST